MTSIFDREIVFASSNPKDSKMISFMLQKGKLKSIAPRIYTTNLMDSPERIIKNNLLDILGWRFPGGILSHKSALLLKPTELGNVYITADTNRIIKDYPGVTVYVTKGKKPIDTDIKLGNTGLYAASEERWMLECMQFTRTNKSGENKSFDLAFIETRLEGKLQAAGEDRFNDFRDKVRLVADNLDMKIEFNSLNKIFSALLNTHNSEILTTEIARARAAGIPYDSKRIRLFEVLYDKVANMSFEPIPAKYPTEQSHYNFAFFEGYFSNFIEGTTFTFEQAKSIVDTGISIPKRIEDSHDIIGTYKIISNRKEMMKTPVSEVDFLNVLRNRHAVLLSGRPECSPGVFKQMNNRAGMTEFVDYNLVEGTLRKGFQIYSNLKEPQAKAIFMMFMCSETHPFTDGNGRLSRIMMNAELSAAGETRIIVPTAYREDYIMSLRKLSRQENPDAFVDVFLKLQRFSVKFLEDSYDKILSFILDCNAAEETEVGREIFLDKIIRRMDYSKIKESDVVKNDRITNITFPKSSNGSHFIRCFIDGEWAGMKPIFSADYLKYKEGVVTKNELAEKYFKDELDESVDTKLTTQFKR